MPQPRAKVSQLKHRQAHVARMNFIGIAHKLPASLKVVSTKEPNANYPLSLLSLLSGHAQNIEPVKINNPSPLLLWCSSYI